MNLRQNFFEHFTTPPFHLLPAAVWLYVLLRYLIHPEVPIMMGLLPDSDDYMYFVATFSWLDHGSWYDHVLPRLDPSYGTALHFSRLAELPLAAITWIFGLILASRQQAAMYAAVVLPLLYFGVFLFVLGWTLRPVVGRRYANIGSCILVLSFSLIVPLFQPGRVDHHGLQIILMCGTLGTVARWLKDGKANRLAVTAVLFALSLWIGLETLPWIAMLGATIIATAAWRSGPEAASLKVFAVVLLAGGLIVLGLSRAPTAWFVADTAAFSIVYTIFLAGMALLSWIQASIRKFNRPVRMIAFFIFGFTVALGYLKLFSAMLAGPYGGIARAQTDEILPLVTEAMPWTELSSGPWEFFLLLLLPLSGFLIACWQCWRQRNREQQAFWIMLAILLLFSAALGVFYQDRVLLFAALFALPPLTWFFVSGQKMLARSFLRKPKLAFVTAMGLAALFYGGMILPGLTTPKDLRTVTGSPTRTEETLLLAQRRAICDAQPVAALLNAPEALGRAPLRIMAPMDDGAELLFLTQPSGHNVFAAPYHNVRSGNRMTRLFFRAARPENAEAVARAQKVDLVVICESFPPMYRLRAERDPLRTSPGNGFASDIVHGRLPPWLEEITLSEPTAYKVFAVRL